jgi:hypothetical protein
VEYSTSKTGKHGHAKAKYAGLDIFTGKRYEDAVPTSHNVEAPVGTCVTVAVCPGKKARGFTTTAGTLRCQHSTQCSARDLLHSVHAHARGVASHHAVLVPP